MVDFGFQCSDGFLDGFCGAAFFEEFLFPREAAGLDVGEEEFYTGFDAGEGFAGEACEGEDGLAAFFCLDAFCVCDVGCVEGV